MLDAVGKKLRMLVCV